MCESEVSDFALVVQKLREVVIVLQIRDLHISFGPNDILTGVDLDVHPGEVVALTGPNGSGKTSLLKAVLRELESITGSITLQKDVSVGFVAQENINETCSVVEFILQVFPDIYSAYGDLQKPDQPMDYANAINRFMEVGGYDIEQKINAEISRFGLNPDDLQRSMSDLSEGEKRLIAILRTLLQGVNLFLLDEPTNHLDIEACLRFEEIIEDLVSRRAGLLVVSHDRVFLDRVADRVIYLRRGLAETVAGGYSQMLEHLESDFKARQHEAGVINRKIRELEEEVARKKNWSEQKEATKCAGVDKGYIGHRAAKLAKRAIESRKKAEKLIGELKDKKPFVEKPISISFPAYEVPNKIVVDASRVSFSYGDNVIFKEATMQVTTRDRVGLIGANGSGKTTFLKCLIGILEPGSGDVKLSASVQWKYIPQDVRELFGDESLLSYMSTQSYNEQEIRHALGAAKFRRDKVYQPVNSLSYGEMMRAAILKSALEKAEFLFLDEPTNHLDIESLELLDELFGRYPGGVFFISHDRHFIAEHGERLMIIEDGAVRSFITRTNADPEEFRTIQEHLHETVELARKRRQEGKDTTQV